MMPKCSAIQEYYLCRQGLGLAKDNGDISNEDLHELLVRIRNEHTEHLREQDLLLNIIRNQSKPQFFREVGANIVGSAIWDSILFLGSKLCKL